MDINSRLYRDNRVTLNDNDSIVAKKMAMDREQAMGKNGFDYVNDTNAHGGPYCALQTTQATTIGSITGEQISGSSITLPSGFLVMGHITSFTLSSGAVIAYKSVS